MLDRWSADGGYGKALKIGMPLVVSMVSSTVMTFTDRIFLGGYSLNALSASVPASVAAFLFLCFFMGVTEYVGVFVAQYTGACRPHKVGRAIWQGMWFCVPSGLLLAGFWFVATPLFDLGGHPQAVRELEIVYFRILSLGGLPFLLGLCLSCFYSGRGLTKTVMVVHMLGAAINIPLDYCLIYGFGPIPEMGIAGAGIATLVGYTLPTLMYVKLVFTRENEEAYRMRSAWRLDRDLFSRFMRFGLPGGVEMFLDIFAISFFVFMVGRYGQVELASTNAVFSIYNLAFMPIIGLNITASIMVGQAMGDRNIGLAAYSTQSVFHMAMAYMAVMGVLFVVFPEFLLNLFRTRGEAGAGFDDVVEMGVVLMRYAAIFTLADAVALVYVGALKGAGDTRYVMFTIAVSSVVFLILPVVVLYMLEVRDIRAPWNCLLAYIVILAVAFVVRFKKGPWKRIEVIDHASRGKCVEPRDSLG
ncbi:MAG: MATE family efflux transporter [Desulfovibrionaceae bacterium]|nr:MATE family efflux transporter [Desulfovibrionaceae bacterium]